VRRQAVGAEYSLKGRGVAKMDRIRIFFASSTKPDVSGRMELLEFFMCLNNVFVGKGLYFTPVFYAQSDDDASGGKTTESLEREINDCSLAFFLIDPDSGAESGDALQEVFKSARENYGKTGKPVIVIYVKQTPEHGVPNADVPSSDTTAGTSSSSLLIPYSEYYKNTYSHIDTLKLGILMQIKQLGLPGVDIRLENGKAWQGADELLALDNVESIAGYENLQNLKHKRAELESRYYAAKSRYVGNPDDEEAYDEFFEVSRQRSDAMQEIQDIESQLYSIIEGMYEQTAGGKLSKRQAEGYRLIERGLLTEARDVLDFYAIVSESRHLEEIAGRYAMEAQVNVDELFQLKDICTALLDWEGVEDCYKEAVRLEEKFDLPRKASEYYVEHLYYQARHSEAVELGERLLQNYQTPGTKATNEDKSLMYNFLGIINMDMQRMEEAEQMLKASLEIRSARTEGDPDKIQSDIAVVYNGFGNLYYQQHQYEKAIAAHKSALEIRLKLVEHNRARYAEYLISTYGNLSDAYEGMQNYEKCAQLLELELELYQNQFVMINYEKDDLLSLCYCNLGDVYVRLQRFEEAEKVLKSALETQLMLAEINPIAYELRLAETHRIIGGVYLRSKRYPEAEEQLSAALTIWKRLARRSPEAYEKVLASCYFSYGELCAETNRLPEAGNALDNAILLYEKYKDSNTGCAEKASEAQKLLGSLSDTRRLPEGLHAGFTPEEQEIAMLLTEGATKREIVRKLGITTVEYSRRVSAIREKVSGMAEADPVIEAVADEFGLTRREADVLAYLRRGAGNDIITDELYLSEETVRAHVRNVLKKLLIENRRDVARWLDEYANA